MKKKIVILAIVLCLPNSVFSQDKDIRLEVSTTLIDVSGPCKTLDSSLINKVMVMWNTKGYLVAFKNLEDDSVKFLTPCVGLHDSLTGSRIAAFCDIRKFVVDIKNSPNGSFKCSIPFPPEVGPNDTFLFNAMTNQGFSITRTSGYPVSIGFDFVLEVWILGKNFSSD